MTVAATWFMQFVSEHGLTLGVAGLVAMTLIVLVISGAAGRIALFVEEHTSDPTGM